MVDVSRNLLLHELFVSQHRWLTSRLLRHADDLHDAQDISSETFEQVVAGRMDPGLIEHPRAFLIKIGQRVVYRRRRERELQARLLEAVALLAEDTAPSAEELASVTQAVVRLDEALYGLPASVREAFLLSQLDGLSYDEIAVQLQISSRTVARYMKQALSCCWRNGFF
ncbi:RNA polymerase sigma-70 factor (ECF subfamily) [Comamonas sp. BIGb0124]|uniref:sigma-70 family RNA polymerase sigma factor n=1 Tax=Comamonas sp. BIGb0124 TaxID=2485130 RepID=UPI000F487203|nr:sigma-70 family RNA polymerase sigma factor [Comamonas sp. BIGb0124]ROR21375.1 RNA polymerase sigma-70 factor (ECF subfamily) [Comamonas sp. BIGb0124]